VQFLDAGRLVVASLVVVVGRPAIAQVQGGSMSAVALSSDHELPGNPLMGGGAQLRVPLGDGPFAFRVGVERLSGQADRIGAPCAGLIAPGTCPQERVRDQARTTGAALRALGGERGTLTLTADWR
jgi:hypothetical protein